MRAMALSLRCWPGPSLTMEMPSSWASSCSSSFRKCAGATRMLFDICVFDLVWFGLVWFGLVWGCLCYCLIICLLLCEWGEKWRLNTKCPFV